jgi:hypothetical protein
MYFPFNNGNFQGTLLKTHRLSMIANHLDRFRNNGSGNRVDWEDVITGSYKGDGFEHPKFDDKSE